jgi:hypothetical protein
VNVPAPFEDARELRAKRDTPESHLLVSLVLVALKHARRKTS